MPIGIYDTAVLNGVVANLLRPQSSLLNKYFTGLNVSDEEEILFDVEDGKRRLAPFVHPTLAGKMVEGLGFKTNRLKPAYVKDLRVFDPRRAVIRQIGESIGGSASPASRVQAAMVMQLTDQLEMLTRRFETMASEILRTGMVTIKGEGFDSIVLDFLRNPAHTVTLAGASRWGQAGVVPLDDIKSWVRTVLMNKGAGIRDVIMEPQAFDLFIADAKTEKQLNDRRIVQGDFNKLEDGSVQGMQYQGTIAGQNYWIYQDWYVDPDTDILTPMMPANSVILASEQLMGVRHFGAIMDEENNFGAQETFTKSWITKNPSVRQLLMQSAPIMAPYRPDASFAATVN